ncbi:outer membrane protein assembly factor BamB [Motiliproteus sp. SC1-56]|uniref:outer membrane protein assembly factor BamB n=1 Tax=Motiliproteus sp. SC1-56 TaxID=2799565 RepID=UPI001A8D3EE0|nr:outer membrane protein assembly factor BamB [Motiliproteus sp. SC1-56]
MGSRLRLLALAAALLLSGCGSWGGDGEIEPSPLVDFEPQAEFQTLWSVRIDQGLGEKYHQYQPALLGNRIYVANYEGTLTAFNQDNGERLWERELGLPVSGGVGVGDGKIALTTYDGEVRVFRALDGAELWQARLSSEALVPVQINQDIALVQTIDGRLTAFDAQSGGRRWQYSAQIPSLTLRGTSTPLLTDDTSYAGFANGKVIALNNATGEPLWESRVAIPQGKTELERIVDVDGPLMLDKGVLYVTSYQGRLAALSVRDGRQLWAAEASSYQGVGLGDEQLFLSTAQDHVQAYGRRGYGPLWEQEGLYFRQLSSPSILDGAVVVADFEGYVHALAAEDGDFLARTRVDADGVRGPLLVANDRLYVLGNGGRLSALTLKPE